MQIQIDPFLSTRLTEALAAIGHHQTPAEFVNGMIFEILDPQIGTLEGLIEAEDDQDQAAKERALAAVIGS